MEKILLPLWKCRKGKHNQPAEEANTKETEKNDISSDVAATDKEGRKSELAERDFSEIKAEVSYRKDQEYKAEIEQDKKRSTDDTVQASELAQKKIMSKINKSKKYQNIDLTQSALLPLLSF